ncbi:hypothetical protein FQR65_LT16823 [Abscondita terminalis]|nr:hypothetical protein FQR65_LT16823 [Abscondita terminalis]
MASSNPNSVDTNEQEAQALREGMFKIKKRRIVDTPATTKRRVEGSTETTTIPLQNKYQQLQQDDMDYNNTNEDEEEEEQEVTTNTNNKLKERLPPIIIHEEIKDYKQFTNYIKTYVKHGFELKYYRNYTNVYGLENLLKKSRDGAVVLAYKKKLNNDYQPKICKIVVNEFMSSYSGLNHKLEIKADTFKIIAKEIVDLFPRTTETYYILYCSPQIGLRKQSVRGKLWSRYINVKAALRLAAANQVGVTNSPGSI